MGISGCLAVYHDERAVVATGAVFNQAEGEFVGLSRTPTDSDTLAEASGGITVKTVDEYDATGVNVISLGSLTHSAPMLDYSFRLDGRERR